MLRVLGFLAMLAFTVYTVVDCAQTEEDRVRGLPKLAWVALILLFPLAGGIAWYFAGRPTMPALPQVGPFAPPPPGPKGPDDDPDFLRRL